MLENYLPILCFLGFAFGLSVVMTVLAQLRGPHKPDKEKLSPYECGFSVFDGGANNSFRENARMPFDVRFYLVAILFILFDLELAFLFPWAVHLGALGWFGVISMMVFLGILTVGFVYEWKKGALDWE